MENLNKFSFQRTSSLIGKIIMEQPRIFLMQLLLLFGTLIIGALLIGFGNSNDYQNPRFYDGRDWAVHNERIFFSVMMFILCVVYVSLAFNGAKSKAGRISLLMLPARYSEKYIARFIVYIVAFPVMFFLAAWVADVVRVLILSMSYPGSIDRIHFMTVNDIEWRSLSQMMAVLLGMQSFYWLGAILWPRNSLIKTFAALFVLSGLYSILTPLFYYLIIGEDSRICDVPGLEFDISDYGTQILWCAALFVCIINYTIAYLRLKETDVIQRLL